MNVSVINWLAVASVLIASVALAVAGSCRPDLVAGFYEGYTCEIADVGVGSIPTNSTALRLLSTATGVRHRRGNLTLPRLPVLKLLEYDVTRGLDAEERPFVHLPDLETLQLFHRASRTDDFRFVLNAGIFEGLQGLKRLILSDLGLSDLPIGVFDRLDSLRILELNQNRLSQVPAGTFTACCQNLSILTLSRNRISDLGIVSRHGLSGLQTLDLSGNQLTTLNEPDFAGLENINSIDLTGNELDRIHERAFRRLSKLQSLHLNENRLSFSNEVDSTSDTVSPTASGGISPRSFSGLRSLQTLEISSNNITCLPTHAFAELVSLRRLDVSRNDIHSLSSEHFACLQCLAELDLSRNRMTSLDTAFHGVFNRLEWLDLSSNPWRCDDCELYWLAEWLRSETDETSFDTTNIEVNNLEHTLCSVPLTQQLLTEAYVNKSAECDSGFDEDVAQTQHAKDVSTTEDEDYGVTSSSSNKTKSTTKTVPLITTQMVTDSDYTTITNSPCFAAEKVTKSEQDYSSTQAQHSGSETGIDTSEFSEDIDSTNTELPSAQTTTPQTMLSSITENIRTLDGLLVTEIANLAQTKKCDTLLSSVTENMKTLDSLLQQTTANIKTLNRLLLTTIATLENTNTQSPTAIRQQNNSFSVKNQPPTALHLAMLLTFSALVQWIRRS